MSDFQMEKQYVVHNNRTGESITVREDSDGLGMTEIVHSFNGTETVIELGSIEQLELLRDAIMERIEDVG